MLILKCKCLLLSYGGTKRHDGNGWNKKRFLYVLRVFFLILQTIIQRTRLIIISLWVPLSLASSFALSWFSVLLKERNRSLGISIHGFKATLQENAGLSHNPLITYKNKKSQALKMLKSTSIWHTWWMSLQDHCLFCFHSSFWTCSCPVKGFGPCDLWRVTLH